MLTPRVTPVMSFLNDFFSPGFPFETTVAMNPFGAVREFAGTPIKTWTPAVDIQRSDGNFIVTAELPGLKKEEVKVEMVDNLLVIEGERKKENKEDHEGYHRYERSYGAFYRAIQLPVGVKMDEVKAELENGLLKISIPVPEPKSNIRHVPVQETAGAKLPN
jgi:HSP20 family protein